MALLLILCSLWRPFVRPFIWRAALQAGLLMVLVVGILDFMARLLGESRAPLNPWALYPLSLASGIMGILNMSLRLTQKEAVVEAEHIIRKAADNP